MLNNQQQEWTGHITAENQNDFPMILEQLCIAFTRSPFYTHNHLKMRVVDDQIEGYVEMAPHLIGNVQFQILHGGVTATILDSMGGVVAMSELYRRSTPETFEETTKKVGKLATLDLRVDYLAPGRGKHFIAKAQVVRLGRKSCLMRMDLHNDQGIHIATGTASYVY